MKRKYIITLLALMLVNIIANTQSTLINPIDRSQNAYNGKITSDYGPRWVSGGSDFHPAIDYNTEDEGPAYCVESGAVVRFKTQRTDGLNYLVVGRWRYQHMLAGLSSDGMWEVRGDGYDLDPNTRTLTKKTQQDLLILRGPEIAPPLKYGIARTVYAHPNHYDDEYFEYGMDAPVSIQHTIPQGTEVFRADPNWSGGAHLDLGIYGTCNNTWWNPLRYLPRNDNETPGLTTLFRRIEGSTIENFTSDLWFGNILIESDVSYEEKDLNNYILELKDDYGAYRKLATWYYEGPNHLELCSPQGSRSSGESSTTPHHNVREKVGVYSISDIRNETEEGIYPVKEMIFGTYPNKHNDSYDIFKYHLVKNYADPLKTTLKDGDHSIRMSATDILGKSQTPIVKNFTLDNFKPFVKKIEVDNPLGNTIYSRIITSNEGNLIIDTDDSGILYNTSKPLYIKVWLSEEPKGLPVVYVGDEYAGINNVSNGEYFTYKIDANLFNGAGPYQVRISGVDLSGNAIFDIVESAGDTSIAHSNIPYRTGLTTFANESRYLDNEIFWIGACKLIQPPVTIKSTEVAEDECLASDGSSNIPIVDFAYTISGENNNIVTLTNNSIFAQYYLWDFGDGETSTLSNNAMHEYNVESYSKSYEVTLNATNIEGETESVSKTIVIPGKDDDISNEPVIINGDYHVKNQDNSVFCTFSYTVLPTDPGYTYEVMLEFGDGTSSSSGTEHLYDKTYSPKTYYPVLIVSVWNGTLFLGDYLYNFNPISVGELPDEELEISFELTTEYAFNTVLPKKDFNLTANIVNGAGKYTYVWNVYQNDISNGGDPGTFENTTNYTTNKSNTLTAKHEEVGNYLVTLTVNDQYGHYGYKEFIVYVANFGGCADVLNMHISNCASNWECPANQPINFNVEYQLNSCLGNNWSAGKIEWFMCKKGSDDETSLGCFYIDKSEGKVIESGKCIVFDEPGTFEIRAEITPYDDYTDWYTGTGKRQLRLRNDQTSWITKEVKVVDCQRVANIDRDIVISPPATDFYNLKVGTINANTTTHNISIENGSRVTWEAYNEITLKPNFHALPGSDFTASIINCPTEGCTGCTVTTGCNIPPYPLYKLPTSAYNVHIEETECLFGHGEYEYWFTVDDKYGKGPYYATLSVYCENDRNCEPNEISDKGRFCDYWCHHKGSYVSQAKAGRKYANLFYGAATNKAIRAYAHKKYGELYRADGKDYAYSGEIKVGCLIKSTEYLDSINNMFTEEGFDLIETFDFELYPNPTEQYVNLEFMGDYNKAMKVEIFNHVGQMIHNIAVDIQATNTIDVDSWSSGVYLVRVITNEGEVFTKKLVKE